MKLRLFPLNNMKFPNKQATYNLLILIISMFMAISCKEKAKTYQGYSKKKDFYYKLISVGDETKKIDSSQYLLILASCRTLTDSIFWDTKHKNNQTFFITRNSPLFLKNIYDFSIGDSLQYLFPTEKFFKDFYNSSVPFFCEKDSCVKFSVKIIRSFNPNRFKQYNDSLNAYINQQKEKENLQIQNYITKNCTQVNEFTTNAYMEKTKITTLDSVKKGKKIKLFYKGYFLDGALVDYTPNNWAFEFTLGQEGQLIDGLQLALYRLKKGEKAKIILPSRLAFGEKGSSNGAVPPYTPLVYQIEIVDIN